MPRTAPLPTAVSLALLAGFAAVTGAAVVAPSRPAAAEDPPPPGRFVPAWPGLAFTNPLGVVPALDGSGTVFVLEQPGRVTAVRPPGTASLFLDLTDRVFPKQQGGLLGLAFHPKYATNGRLFVCYLAESGSADVPFKIVLAEYRGSAAAADPASARVLLEIPKSFAMHNGGAVVFGPDGMLYLGTGDNKLQKEAVQTSQNPSSLLGKVLRLDVDRASPPLPYGVPTDNPWAGAGAPVRPEIWAYGFRNAWRLSFDPEGRLWTCDPGSGGECRETVILVQRGGNHGWPFFEGTRPMEPVPPGMAPPQVVPPVFEYVRTGGEGSTAAIGGHVYRGAALPTLRGRYLFADYGRGLVMSIRVDGRQGSDLRVVGPVPNVSSLGEDAAGEIYACAFEQGVVYRLVP